MAFLLFSSVTTYATKNAEQDMLTWIILLFVISQSGQYSVVSARGRVLRRIYPLDEVLQLVLQKHTDLAERCGNPFG